MNMSGLDKNESVNLKIFHVYNDNDVLKLNDFLLWVERDDIVKINEYNNKDFFTVLIWYKVKK